MDVVPERVEGSLDNAVRQMNEHTPKARTLLDDRKPDHGVKANTDKRSPHETPKTPCSKPVERSPLEFSICNPFESHDTINSLLQPSFSPSVFRIDESGDADSEKTPGSFWSIDQIAVLKPADIDLSHLHKQQEFIRLDPAMEKQAQQAIDDFFASSIDMASPWSGERNRSHFLALISPSPAQMKKRANLMTPGAGKLGSSSTSASSLSSSSRIRFQKVNVKNGRFPATPSEQLKMAQQSRIKDDEVFLQNSPVTKNKKKCNMSTQTTLTLPVNFDLEKLLSKFYTFADDREKTSESVCEALSNSSLRRKLFFPDGEDAKTQADAGAIEPSPLKQIDDDRIVTSPLDLHKTPCSKKSSGTLGTPSTCQSHFSSSPFMSGGGHSLRTPCSGDFQRPRFGSGVRRKMLLGSSEDDELGKIQMNDLESPELSPVKADTSLGVESERPMHDLVGHGLDGVSSMSFTVSGTQNQEDTTAETLSCQRTSGDSEKFSALESSRKQILLDSPPLSPIEPLKQPQQLKACSSVNYLNSSDNRSLGAPQQLFSLCPSPMLSPIVRSSKEKKGKHAKPPPESPLSSTTSSLMQGKSKVTYGKHRLGLVPEGRDENTYNTPMQQCKDQDMAVFGSCANKENLSPQCVFSLGVKEANSQKEEEMNCSVDIVPIAASSSDTHSGERTCSDLIPFDDARHCNTQHDSLAHQLSGGQRSSAEETLNTASVDDCAMDVSPRKPFRNMMQEVFACEDGNRICKADSSMTSDAVNACSMDVSLHHVPHKKSYDCDITSGSNNPTEGQGDSGYSTAQSNLHAC